MNAWTSAIASWTGAVHRIGNSAEVGLQASDQFIHCLIKGFAANPHFGKALMMNVDPRRTAGVAKLLCHNNHSRITSHKQPFPKHIALSW